MEQNEPVNPTPEGNQTSPQPQEHQAVPPLQSPSPEEKQWATFTHLSALAGLIGVPFGNILGPLVLWLIKKDALPFVNQQGKEALNFQISCTIYGLLMTPTLCFPPLFVLLIAALAIVNLVFVIMACVAANKGEPYRYPVCLRLVK